MVENLLEGIMTNEEFQELMKASENNRDYKFNKNGLDISMNSSDNGFELSVKYTNPVQSEVEKFTDFLNGLDDELFVDICEQIGNDGLQKIQDCLDSENIESVRSAVSYFKAHARKFIADKTKYLNEQLVKFN